MGDARDEHAVADLDVLHAVADWLNRADRLVPESSSGRHFGDVTLDDVKAGARDGHRVDSDCGVGVGGDLRRWYFLPGDLPRSVEYERESVDVPFLIARGTAQKCCMSCTFRVRKNH